MPALAVCTCEIQMQLALLDCDVRVATIAHHRDEELAKVVGILFHAVVVEGF